MSLPIVDSSSFVVTNLSFIMLFISPVRTIYLSSWRDIVSCESPTANLKSFLFLQAIPLPTVYALLPFRDKE